MKMSVRSLACKQSVFQRYHGENIEFYPQDGGESQLALKLRHCHLVYWLRYWLQARRLDVSTVQGVSDTRPLKCPVTLGDPGSRLLCNTLFIEPTRACIHKRFLDRFSRFCGAHGRNQHACDDSSRVCSNSPHLRIYTYIFYFSMPT